MKTSADKTLDQKAVSAGTLACLLLLVGVGHAEEIEAGAVPHPEIVAVVSIGPEIEIDTGGLAPTRTLCDTEGVAHLLSPHNYVKVLPDGNSESYPANELFNGKGLLAPDGWNFAVSHAYLDGEGIFHVVCPKGHFTHRKGSWTLEEQPEEMAVPWKTVLRSDDRIWADTTIDRGRWVPIYDSKRDEFFSFAISQIKGAGTPWRLIWDGAGLGGAGFSPGMPFPDKAKKLIIKWEQGDQTRGYFLVDADDPSQVNLNVPLYSDRGRVYFFYIVDRQPFVRFVVLDSEDPGYHQPIASHVANDGIAYTLIKGLPLEIPHVYYFSLGGTKNFDGLFDLAIDGESDTVMVAYLIRPERRSSPKRFALGGGEESTAKHIGVLPLDFRQ